MTSAGQSQADKSPSMHGLIGKDDHHKFNRSMHTHSRLTRSVNVVSHTLSRSVVAFIMSCPGSSTS